MAPAEDLAVVERRDKSKVDPLLWLKLKEAKELELLRGQSSMWFYLEVRRIRSIVLPTRSTLATGW